MGADRLFDCAQVLILPDDADAEKSVRLIRDKQFWHVVVSGNKAFAFSRKLREYPGMPNFIVEEAGDGNCVKEMLALRSVDPMTLAVTEDQSARYAEVFPQAKMFVVSVQKDA